MAKVKQNTSADSQAGELNDTVTIFQSNTYRRNRRDCRNATCSAPSTGPTTSVSQLVASPPHLLQLFPQFKDSSRWLCDHDGIYTPRHAQLPCSGCGRPAVSWFEREGERWDSRLITTKKTIRHFKACLSDQINPTNARQTRPKTVHFLGMVDVVQ